MIRFDIRLRLPFESVPDIPFLTSAYADGLLRKRAYEEVFYGSEAGARVLADILQSNGVASSSFSGRFDAVAAAHADGMKTAALQIFSLAGGREGRLARAMTLNQMKETRDE